MIERTFAMIKPDAKDRTEEIIKDILADGFTIVAQKKMRLTEAMGEKFYAEHRSKTFFGELVLFISSDEVTVMVLEKEGAIEAWRWTLGHTDPSKAYDHTIRGKYGDKKAPLNPANIAHGSDSFAAADREINLMFSPIERLAFEKPTR